MLSSPIDALARQLEDVPEPAKPVSYTHLMLPTNREV